MSTHVAVTVRQRTASNTRRLSVESGNRDLADVGTDMSSHFANLANVSFADALLLFPTTVVIHVCEEWPRFPRRARRFGSPTYSDRDYIVTHALAIVAASAFVMLLRARGRLAHGIIRRLLDITQFDRGRSRSDTGPIGQPVNE